MKNLKEQYWKNGNIFRMSNNDYRMVWGDRLINASGYIHKKYFNSTLVNTDSTLNEHVIEVYAPNVNAGYFRELIKPTTEPIWRKYKHVYTMEEIEKTLGISNSEDLFIIK